MIPWSQATYIKPLKPLKPTKKKGAKTTQLVWLSFSLLNVKFISLWEKHFALRKCILPSIPDLGALILVEGKRTPSNSRICTSVLVKRSRCFILLLEESKMPSMWTTSFGSVQGSQAENVRKEIKIEQLVTTRCSAFVQLSVEKNLKLPVPTSCFLWILNYCNMSLTKPTKNHPAFYQDVPRKILKVDDKWHLPTQTRHARGILSTTPFQSLIDLSHVDLSITFPNVCKNIIDISCITIHAPSNIEILNHQKKNTLPSSCSSILGA